MVRRVYRVSFGKSFDEVVPDRPRGGMKVKQRRPAACSFQLCFKVAVGHGDSFHTGIGHVIPRNSNKFDCLITRSPLLDFSSPCCAIASATSDSPICPQISSANEAGPRAQTI